MTYFGLNRKSAWHGFLMVLGCWMFTMAWAPAAKAQTCVSESLATLMATTPTCDIGSIQFTFDGIDSVNVTDNDGTDPNTITHGTLWTDSNFTITVLSNGFTLTFSGGPQSVTAPAYGSVQEYAQLLYSAVDTNGTFTGASATGGTVTATGTFYSYSVYENFLFNSDSSSEALGYNEAFQVGGMQTGGSDENGLVGAPFSSGTSGGAVAFELFANDGDSATWDGTPTTFTFDTASPTPEPTTMLLFATGLLGIILVNRKKLLA